ncbi:heavy-metal-associated domain-containing protein [Agromyces silvae]|uniref:heavy-metal-associated domain-containing protein n=1 Tax=Agromyces silvae TaxID=3388266 RepID=UPI00280B9E59|nr:heavy metal-associated domain-containing protein [Agromyces protaetiae]
MTSTEFEITGMTCAHCEQSVREEVGQIAGVDEIRVSAQTGLLVVTGAAPVDDTAVLAAVGEAGYSATRVQ